MSTNYSGKCLYKFYGIHMWKNHVDAIIVYKSVALRKRRADEKLTVLVALTKMPCIKVIGII